MVKTMKFQNLTSCLQIKKNNYIAQLGPEAKEQKIQRQTTNKQLIPNKEI